METNCNVGENANSLELFFGEATDAEARVYARLPSHRPLDGWRLTGTLTGPECRFARTLPATFTFRDVGSGQGPLAQAIITEPCFWTPELPFLYRAIIEVYSSRSAVRPVITAERDEYTLDRPFGIRRLGAIGRSVYLDGKRWVARGVCRDRADSSDLLVARGASAVLRIRPPDDAYCLEASRLGVPLFVDLDVDEPRLLPEIRRLGRWPAVFAIILDPATPIGADHRAAARNTLFAVPLLGSVRPAPDRAKQCRAANMPAWAQLALCDASSIESFAQAIQDCPLPILAVRESTANLSIEQARAACDRLQFDLAPTGDFAGYFV